MHHVLDVEPVDPSGAEPGLRVDLRDERRSLLFDLGHAIAALPPRALLRVSLAFVTHTHMDHFAGFDHLLAVGLGRVPRLSLWGGPGFVDQVEHKLRAYTWNVVHRYEMPLLIEACELGLDGSRRRASFASTQGFARRDAAAPPGAGDVLHDETLLRVRGRFVDHEMPVLALALEEKARLRVAPDRLHAMGFTPGAWLRHLKEAVLAGAAEDTPIEVAWRDRGGPHRAVRTVGELRELVLDPLPGRRIGYVTDLRFTEANIGQLAALLQDVDLLHIESVFLHEDRDQALRKNHLTARQAGEIARRLGARAIAPFHFSRRYDGRFDELAAEATAAWQGG